MKAFLQISGVRGNSGDPYHTGWIELDRLDMASASKARRPRGAPSNWVPPLVLQCAAVTGPFALALKVAADTGRSYDSATLDVVGARRGGSVASTRVRMQQLHVSTYETVEDPGLRQPFIRFTLVADEHRYERGVALDLAMPHEALHAS